ncbi:UNVERIFIED_CONTAM: hypothetical protein K2H54_053374 [Gekko kuhli]
MNHPAQISSYKRICNNLQVTTNVLLKLCISQYLYDLLTTISSRPVSVPENGTGVRLKSNLGPPHLIIEYNPLLGAPSSLSGLTHSCSALLSTVAWQRLLSHSGQEGTARCTVVNAW